MRSPQKSNNELTIPIGAISGEDDVFVFDDVLRMLGNKQSRHALLSAVGASGLSNWEYEKRNSFPFGTIELALMTEDSTFQERNAAMQEQIKSAINSVPLLNEVFNQYASFMAGLSKVYPQGMLFLQRFAAQSNNSRLYNVEPLVAEDTSVTFNVYVWVAAHTLVIANAFLWANLSIATEAFALAYVVVSAGVFAVVGVWIV